MSENKLTYQIKLNLFNDYDTYKQIVKTLREKKTRDERLEVIRYYVKTLVDSGQLGDILIIKRIDFKYLLSCFDEDLKA